MDYQKLDPRSIRMWRVSRMITLIFLLAAYAALVLAIGADRPWLLLAAAAPLLVQLGNILLYPPIEYRQWSYLIAADRIEIKKGIFFRSTRVIPMSRIQHVTLSEGPLARFYHLASVTIHTAGGSMKVDGLARETAAEICENLKSVVNRKAHYEPGGG